MPAIDSIVKKDRFIPFEETSFSLYHIIILLLYFSIKSNGDINSISNIEWVLFGIISFSLFIRLLNSGLVINKYLVWFISFTTLTLISYFWSTNSYYALMGIKVMINIVPISIYLHSLVRYKKDVEKIVKIFIAITFLTSIYVLLRTYFSFGSFTRLTDGLGGGWNPNVFGMQVAFAFCFCIAYMQGEFSKVRSKRTSIVLVILFFLIITFMTGSKKSLLIIVVFIGLYYSLFQKSKKIKSLFFVILWLVITFYLIFEVPFFYRTIGLRVEQFIRSIVEISPNDRTGDLARLDMIERGWRFFLEHPLFGHGPWSYASLNEIAYGDNRYSHNNYIEMLVNFGVIGTTIYYSIYYYLLKKSIFSVKDKFVASIVTCLLITDIAYVSYYSFYYIIILIISSALLKVDKL